MGKRRKKKIYYGPNITEKHNFFEGQVIKTKIEKYDNNGVGIGFYKDVPILVFNSILGEEIELLIKRIFPEKIIGEIKNIIDSSNFREDVPCEFFGKCTGCQWLHINYNHQLELKKEIVEENLKQNEVIYKTLVNDTVPSKKKHYYRNHARFTIRGKNEIEEMGYVNFLTREWVNVNHCLIMNHMINNTMIQLQQNLSNKTQISIRASDSTKSYLVQPKFENLELETGQKYYTERIFDNSYQVASPSFFQVNISQVEEIFNSLLKLKIFNIDDLVVDAYCGVGTFTCLIAPYVKKIIGIEESVSAVNDAKENSKKFQNIDYLLGKTEDVLLQIERKIDVLLLDPPRIGCDDEVIKIIERINPKKIILISCSPENFAIDIAKLTKISYEVSEITPFDMFPQTHHVEILGLLEFNNE